jgi:hypothetical protein
MNRAVEKIEGDESHDMMTFTLEGEREYQEYARVFPDPLPSTHRLAYRWDENDRGQRVLKVRVVPVPAGGPGKQPPAPPATPTNDGTPNDRAAATEARRKELDARTKADLQTLGAELGLDLVDAQTKAQMVALILEAEANKAAAAAKK